MIKNRQNQLIRAQKEEEREDKDFTKLKGYIDELLKTEFKLANLPECVQKLKSADNRFFQHFGVIGIRKILSSESPALISSLRAAANPAGHRRQRGPHPHQNDGPERRASPPGSLSASDP